MTDNIFPYYFEMEVRDYELDLQGIVNNSVYLNYLEHSRHEFIKTLGINFRDYSKRGINFVAVRTELDYKYSLTSGDRFRIGIRISMESPLRIVFHQEIFRIPDNRLILKGKTIATVLNERGRPHIPDEVKAAIESFCK